MDFLTQLAQIDLLTYTQGLGIFTLVCLVLTVVAFIFKWGIRFRLVGVTSFMGVVTGSVFGLSLGLFTHTDISGAVRYSLVFDNAADKVTIVLPSTVTESEVEATLRQAVSDIQPFGRSTGQNAKLVIRARTVLHPEPGLSQLLYLGQATRGTVAGTDEPLEISIFAENLAQLPDSVNSNP
jgi:Protein of function (DUF2518)